ncbi:MAG: N(4)-(beta-N-acetylglucosaminyl)-L-asparaginase [Planctomycetes bacterium]|nr:N(4)-(beta-N-acetylglucosaminyl)-L-asparaginase [Planctomycetota bacterium]MBU4398750.1 N(4)-(beta-N-acetylglucosaminyl)-L-asparaginase [Planctomycetota bacterium]MCG2685229.1 N(4)-(beta-N-acetylglucosaminyl)-L-asparaginase [Planctomycetales bacterium]
MSEPIILSTWSFGKKANAAGWPYLTGANQSSLDAVEQACRAIEADTEVRSVGCGGCPDRSGDVSLDASIMVSPSRCGSVCYVRRFPHPVSIARLVMDRLNLVMLAGEGADRFAARQGLTAANLLTKRAQTMWQNWVCRHPAAQIHDDAIVSLPTNLEESDSLPVIEAEPHNKYHDTVGVLAMDSREQIAGACSTSGLPFKVPGRVGDSPIVGHGLYVDPRRGAAVATGMGELIMGVCGSFLAVELMGRGAEPKDAAREVLQRIVEAFQLPEMHQVAIMAINPSGLWSSAALRPGYFTAVRTTTRDELVAPECVLFP